MGVRPNPPPELTHAVAVRVMTFNVRYFANLARLKGVHSSRRTVEHVARALATLPHLPDLISLQEVETRSLRSAPSHARGETKEIQIQTLMRNLDRALAAEGRAHRFRAHYFPAHVYGLGRARLYTTGLAILVRDDVRVRSQRAKDITYRSRFVTRYLKQSRICAHVVAATADGVAYDVFNTHLSLPAFFPNNFYRLPSRMGFGPNQAQEVEELARFIEKRRSGDRYVVMGDFNSLPGSPAYGMIQARLAVRDPFLDLLGQSVDQLREVWPTAGFMRYRMRLDHMFAGPGLRWVDFEDTHAFGDRNGRWHGLSDHVPIVGRFVAR